MTIEEIEEIGQNKYPYGSRDTKAYKDFQDCRSEGFIEGAKLILLDQAKGKDEIKKTWEERSKYIRESKLVDTQVIWDFFEPHLNTQKEEWISVKQLPEDHDQECLWVEIYKGHFSSYYLGSLNDVKNFRKFQLEKYYTHYRILNPPLNNTASVLPGA